MIGIIYLKQEGLREGLNNCAQQVGNPLLGHSLERIASFWKKIALTEQFIITIKLFLW